MTNTAQFSFQNWNQSLTPLTVVFTTADIIGKFLFLKGVSFQAVTNHLIKS